eukprot:TRINITY_DN47832_c0_g1_i1.p1 TRINITY_DN47832_c0_g1~~TRINITY_DN47832_c0_g1_i1.p1  ORF type:complete len:262 (+),score=74.47 TRINITY_DN47832_c0_g1_i1:88-873(+)
MGKVSKQAERNAKKKPVAEDEPETGAPASGGKLLEIATELVLGSALAKFGPKTYALLTSGDRAKPVPVSKEGEDTTEESKAEAPEPTDAAGIFEALKTRIAWQNCLGLAKPSSPEEAMQGWMNFKALEFDGGPKAKRKGTPGMDRVMKNFCDNMVQYVYILLGLMILRVLLFRSWFACLPWLVGYQALSLFLPLETMEVAGQKLPLEKCDVQIRVALSLAIHALVLLFFAYELLYCTYFMEKMLLVGVVVGHSYVMRPVEA